ncbi:MAG: hypothetical protein ACI8U4_001106 [Natronomonas sp.]|jgi:hypothetical protein
MVLLFTVALTVMVGIGMATAASAQEEAIETNVTTDYNGTTGDSQAVQVTATFTAKTDIDQLRIEVSETEDSFVDFDSIEPSVQGEGVDVSSPEEGVYEVEQLSEGQAITLELKAYPRRLDADELGVTRFELSAENPRTLDVSTTATADLSSSPLLQYRQAQEELSQTQLLDTGTLAGIGGAFVVGLGGLVFGILMYRKRDEAAASAYSDVLETLQTFRTRQKLESSAKNRLDTIIEDIDEKVEQDDVQDEGDGGTEADEGPDIGI